MCHGAAAPLLHWQSWLATVERLDLALLIDRQHDGVGRWIDVEPDDVVQFAGEARVVGQLEMPRTVRLPTMFASDALHRTDTDPACLGHVCGRPVGGRSWWIGQRQSDHPLRHVPRERRDARRKSLANRRVSFAAEATLHTFHEVEFPQDSTTSTDSTRRASSARNSNVHEDESTAQAQQYDASSNQANSQQSKRRRSSGISAANFGTRDDDTATSTIYSSDSEPADVVDI